MISDRIANLSSSKEVYDKEVKPYQDALNAAGYKQPLIYRKSNPNKRKRKRQVLWFNPPFSETVKTNVGSKFLHLIDKHFKGTELEKYFNRKTVKVSYSCMPNAGAIIAGHNKKTIKMKADKDKPTISKSCNCRSGKQSCPLQGQCLQSSMIYKASIKTSNEHRNYIGQAGNTFKERYTNHKASFKHRMQMNSTELSKHVWKIKDKNTTYDLRWSKMASAPTYTPSTGKCNLCILEKTLILFSTEELLNRRNEIMNKCRHRNKYLLEAVT